VLTLILIEPIAVLRQSLRNWLEVDLSPCSILETEDVPGVLLLPLKQPPHAIILDLDTFSVIEQGDIWQLNRLYPMAAIIGMGLDDTPSHRRRAKLAGITVFVPKSQLQADLIRALVKTY